MRLAAIVIAFGILGAASAVQAMPIAPTKAPSAIITVAGGCGPGWHPNRWGRCVPNRWRRAPIYRGYGWYGPPRYYRGPGWHHRRWHHRHWRRW